MMTDLRVNGEYDLGFFRANNSTPGILDTISNWTTGQFQNLAINVAYEPVPEPASLAGLAFGLGAMLRRRNSKKNSKD
jgi:hypothetical protein